MTDNDWKILARYGVTPDNLTVAGSIYLSAHGHHRAARQFDRRAGAARQLTCAARPSARCPTI
jgi:hypothetical protein